MLWKLFSSDKKVVEALRRSSVSIDLTPDRAQFPANNDEPPEAVRQGKSRLWLEDWSEKDEERLRNYDDYWGVVVGGN